MHIYTLSIVGKTVFLVNDHYYVRHHDSIGRVWDRVYTNNALLNTPFNSKSLICLSYVSDFPASILAHCLK